MRLAESCEVAGEAAPADLVIWRLGIVPEFDNPRRSIALKLVILAKQLRQRFDQRVETIGITSAKWTLIAAVARHPGATQRSIADLLEITEVTAGRLIDRLCADGYLRRTPHPQDRRAYCVELTEAAMPLLERLGAIAAYSETEVFDGFSDDDVAKLEALLDAALNNLTEAKRRALAAASAARIGAAPQISIAANVSDDPDIDIVLTSDTAKYGEPVK